MECWPTKSRGKKRKKLIDDSFFSWKKKKSNRRERTWQIALWTHWRSWIVSPEEHPTDHPTTDGTKLRGNAIGRDKSSLFRRPSRYLTCSTWSMNDGKKSIGHPTKSWIFETWVDSLVADGVDSFSSGWLALTFFHVNAYLLLFRFFMPQFRALDPPWFETGVLFNGFLSSFLGLNLLLLFNDRQNWKLIELVLEIFCVICEI